MDRQKPSKNPQTHKAFGEQKYDSIYPWGSFPSEYRLSYKELFLYGQRVRKPHRGQSPSSVTQLPILTALHARFPTLFAVIIQYLMEKVNPQFTKSAGFL